MRILRNLYLTAALGLASLSPAIGQGASTAESLQVAMELVSLMSGNMLADAVAKTATQVWPAMEKELRAQHARIDAATLAELRSEFERQMTSSLSDVMKDAPALYARHFSAQDMRAMLAFYRTPAGMNSLKAMPLLSAEVSPRCCRACRDCRSGSTWHS